jgi:Fic family protein
VPREYERTHPWIRFQIDLRSAPPGLWLLLGEAQSKSEHVAGLPLKPALHEHFNRVFLAKGVRATTAIEGNTLTEEEALAHLEGRLDLPPSKQYLARELDNVLAAVNEVWSDVAGRFSRPTPEILRHFDRQVLEGLELQPEVVPGEVRKHSVGVGGYRGAPAEDCEYLLERLCTWLSGPDFAPRPGEEVATAILKAVLGHLYLASVHPFGDGNGRTARLLEFQILVQAGMPMPCAHLLSNHYNATRADYYRQLDRAHRSGGDVVPFLAYAVRGLVDGLREQVEWVRNEQWAAAWRDLVYERFEDKRTPAEQRRLRLLLDLSNAREPVQRAKLAEISPRVAREYARKTAKALTRDLNILKNMNLVVDGAKGVAANRGVMLAYVPHRKPAAAQ